MRFEKEMNYRIFQAVSEADVDIARGLFLEYAEKLGFDLDFQDFRTELADIPGQYFPPEGALLLADAGGIIAGCAGMRKFTEAVCEMKRMYVKPEFRGKGIGRKMSQILIDAARKAGYKSMRLDTIDSMIEARELYKSLGFRVIPAYRYNPIEGTVYMELEL